MSGQAFTSTFPWCVHLFSFLCRLSVVSPIFWWLWSELPSLYYMYHLPVACPSVKSYSSLLCQENGFVSEDYFKCYQITSLLCVSLSSCSSHPSSKTDQQSLYPAFCIYSQKKKLTYSCLLASREENFLTFHVKKNWGGEESHSVVLRAQLYLEVWSSFYV